MREAPILSNGRWFHTFANMTTRECLRILGERETYCSCCDLGHVDSSGVYSVQSKTSKPDSCERQRIAEGFSGCAFIAPNRRRELRSDRVCSERFDRIVFSFRHSSHRRTEIVGS